MRTREHQNQVGVVEEWAGRAPGPFRAADGHGDDGDDFVDLVAYHLHTTVDRRWGLNKKRGGSDQSKDCLAWLRSDDDGSGQFVEVIDVVGGAGGPDPRPAWQDQTNYGTIGNPGTARWFAPTREAWMDRYLGATEPGPGPTPDPPPTPPPSPDPGAGTLTAKIDALMAEVVRLRADFTAMQALAQETASSAATAAAEATNAAGRASDLKDTLAKGAGLTGSIRYVGGIQGGRISFEVTNQG